MPTLLAIDAATDACSVAIWADGRISEDFRLLPKSHTQFLLPMIDEHLRQCGLALQEIDAIAFTAGPGSFTGLRVACAVVQGLAFARDIPVIPVSTLHAMAQHVTDTVGLPDDRVVVPMLDARMGEVYWGAYRVLGGKVVPLDRDALCSPGDIDLTRFNCAAICGVGDGWQFADQFQGGADVVEKHIDLAPHAGAILPLAAALLAQGQGVPAHQAQPVYLRDSVAWQKS